MGQKLSRFLRTELENLRQAGLLKSERVFASPQDPVVTLGDREVINLTSSDYLGLSVDAAVQERAGAAAAKLGLGLSADRLLFSQPIHAELESALSAFLGTEETLVVASSYHANASVFESLVNERDSVFCDELCHPSVADGIRLSRARVASYLHDDLDHLEDRLKRSRAARFRVIATEGVFPLSGAPSSLSGICDLAEKYDALVVVHDGLGLGVLGERGRGVIEHHGVQGRVGLVTGGLHHALGAGGGGFLSGRSEVVGWLRQKARPHLVSPALAPPLTAAALAALEAVEAGHPAQEELRGKVRGLRARLDEVGLDVVPSEHPLLAVRVGDAVAVQRMANGLFAQGVYAVGFCHPVVPEGAARLCLHVTARHTEAMLDRVGAALAVCGREAGVL